MRVELYGCLKSTGIVYSSFTCGFVPVRKPFNEFESESESQSQSQSENTVFTFLWHSMNRALNKITFLVHVF